MSGASIPFLPTIPTGDNAPLGPPPDAASAGASRVPLLTGVTVLCMTIVTVVTSLRLYTRHVLLNQIGFDDALAVIAALSVISVGILYLIHTKYGLGGHIWEATSSLEDLITSLKLVYAEGVLYNVSLFAIKITLFSQYYRLISQTAHRVPYLVIAVLVTAWCLGMTLLVILACIPVEAAWDPTITEKDCTGASRGILIAVGNIVTDFILLLLPLPMVLKLKMKLSQKMAIVGIFGIGSFTCIVSIIRISFLQITPDFTYSAVIIDCWTIGELAAGCCCPSLMVLQPFVKKVGVNLASFRRSSRKQYNTSSGSGPSARKPGSIPDMPGNMHGSEVELCSMDLPAKYDDRQVAGSVV